MERKHRKAITLNPIFIEIVEEEIERRGGKTSFSALINELLAERYAKEFKIKQLEREHGTKN